MRCFEDLVSTKRNGDALLALPEERTKDPYEDLAFSIILAQVEDLQKSMRAAKNTGKNVRDCSQMEKAKWFFSSPWFQELCLDTLDGPTCLEKIINKYEQEIQNEK